MLPPLLAWAYHLWLWFVTWKAQGRPALLLTGDFLVPRSASSQVPSRNSIWKFPGYPLILRPRYGTPELVTGMPLLALPARLVMTPAGVEPATFRTDNA